jgi:hypothetical protein
VHLACFCGDFLLHKGHKSCGSLLHAEFIPKTGTRPETDGVSEQLHQISHTTIIFSLFSNNDVFGDIDVVTSFNLLNPTGDFTYHQVQHSRILHGDHIAFKYSMWISEQTLTFRCTYNINTTVFTTEVESVYSAVRTKPLYNTDAFHL